MRVEETALDEKGALGDVVKVLNGPAGERRSNTKETITNADDVHHHLLSAKVGDSSTRILLEDLRTAVVKTSRAQAAVMSA